MSATPRKISRNFNLIIHDGNTLETIRSEAARLRHEMSVMGFDPQAATAYCGEDTQVNVWFACERMETQEEADARENDPRDIQRAMVARTRRAMDRLAMKYSLEDLEKL